MKLNLERNKTYILGCSFGPDSMALLDLLLKENYKFVVCNINYNHRDISTKESEALKEYCKQKNLSFYSKSVLFPGKNLNFESWAREIRYNYFYEIGSKLGIYDILIAHNEDDLFETYFLQIDRKNYVNYYGLKEQTKAGNFNIIRPLLKYTKNSLLEYCKTNNIPFSIDKTNYDLTLKRNYFRHEVIAKMSDEEKNELHKKIDHLNLKKELQNLRVLKYIKGNNINKNDLANLSLEDAHVALIKLINKEKYIADISLSLTRELLKAIKGESKSWHYEINDEYSLRLNYDNITLINKKINYKEVIKKDNFKSLNFRINPHSKYYEKIAKSEYFVIKPCQTQLFYQNLNIRKKVSRWFIDWKMPWELRYCWPGIYNEKGELVFIPRYQKVPEINENSLLIFDLEKIFQIK